MYLAPSVKSETFVLDREGPAPPPAAEEEERGGKILWSSEVVDIVVVLIREGRRGKGDGAGRRWMMALTI